jgi:hypothetical protein
MYLLLKRSKVDCIRATRPLLCHHPDQNPEQRSLAAFTAGGCTLLIIPQDLRYSCRKSKSLLAAQDSPTGWTYGIASRAWQAVAILCASTALCLLQPAASRCTTAHINKPGDNQSPRKQRCLATTTTTAPDTSLQLNTKACMSHLAANHTKLVPRAHTLSWGTVLLLLLLQHHAARLHSRCLKQQPLTAKLCLPMIPCRRHNWCHTRHQQTANPYANSISYPDGPYSPWSPRTALQNRSSASSEGS